MSAEKCGPWTLRRLNFRKMQTEFRTQPLTSLERIKDVGISETRHFDFFMILTFRDAFS